MPQELNGNDCDARRRMTPCVRRKKISVNRYRILPLQARYIMSQYALCNCAVSLKEQSRKYPQRRIISRKVVIDTIVSSFFCSLEASHTSHVPLHSLFGGKRQQRRYTRSQMKSSSAREFVNQEMLSDPVHHAQTGKKVHRCKRSLFAVQTRCPAEIACLLWAPR